MKRLDFMNSTALYIELGQSSLKVLKGDAGLEISLERSENGRLTDSCRKQVTHTLRDFLKKKGWQTRLRAFCAVGARGVSLRHLTIPPSTKEELQRVLRLQIESEFPLPPDELAWGYRLLNSAAPAGTMALARQEAIVAALKKEVLEEYAEMLAGCGVNPVFTLAALARNCLCPQPPGSYAMLDIGRSHSELICFENGAPGSIRILPWGGEDLTRSIAEKLGITHPEAEKLKVNLDQEPVARAELGQMIQSAMAAALETLAASIRSHWTGQTLYLSGRSARHKDIAPQLARYLGGGVACERLELMPGEGRSAAILGLKRSTEKEGGSPPLVLRLKETKGGESIARPAPWKWAAVAALLAIASLSFPYAEALLLKPRLSKRLSVVKADKGRLSTIDRELSFLQFLKQSQPPYLDAVALIAGSAPAGSRIDSLAMNRRGELALRGNLKDSQQVVDFRSKLIASGFFSTVVVEEQAPSPDRQKVVVRITAQWKSAGALESVVIDPPAPAVEKAKAAGKDLKPGASPAVGTSAPPTVGTPPPRKNTKE
jgi:Tfp pilus assembly PilM family ATPase